MEDLIEEFLEELIDKNEITANERTDMKLTLLEAMPREMTEETKGRVMSSLKSKMETPSANIFTDKGVNIDAVRTIANESVKEVVKAVEKEEQAKVEAEAKIDAKVSEVIDSIILDADKKEEEQLKSKENDLMELTDDNVDDYYKVASQRADDYFSRADGLTAEKRRTLVIERTHADMFLKMFEQKRNSGMSVEDAKSASFKFLQEQLGEDLEFEDLKDSIESIIRCRLIDEIANNKDEKEILETLKNDYGGLIDVDASISQLANELRRQKAHSKGESVKEKEESTDEKDDLSIIVSLTKAELDFVRGAESYMTYSARELTKSEDAKKKEISDIKAIHMIDSYRKEIDDLQTSLKEVSVTIDVNKILNIKQKLNKRIITKNKYERDNGYKQLSPKERQVVDKRNYLIRKAAELYLESNIDPYEIISKLGAEAEQNEILPLEIVKCAEKMVIEPTREQNEIFKNDKKRIQQLIEIEAYEQALQTAKIIGDSKAVNNLQDKLKELKDQATKHFNGIIEKKQNIGLKKNIDLEDKFLNNISSELNMQEQFNNLSLILKLRNTLSVAKMEKQQSGSDVLVSLVKDRFDLQKSLGKDFMELIERYNTEDLNTTPIDLEKELDKLINIENKKYIEIVSQKSEQYRQEIESVRYTDYTDSKYSHLVQEKDRIDRELRKAYERDMILDENASKDDKALLLEDQRDKESIIRGGVYNFLRTDKSILDIWKDLKRQGIHDIDPQDIVNEFIKVSQKMKMPENIIYNTVNAEMNMVNNDTKVKCWEELANYAEAKGEDAYVNELKGKIKNVRETNIDDRRKSNEAKVFTQDIDIKKYLVNSRAKRIHKGKLASNPDVPKLKGIKKNSISYIKKRDKDSISQDVSENENKRTTTTMDVSKLLIKNQVRSSEMVEQISELTEQINDKSRTVSDGR